MDAANTAVSEDEEKEFVMRIIGAVKSALLDGTLDPGLASRWEGAPLKGGDVLPGALRGEKLKTLFWIFFGMPALCSLPVVGLLLAMHLNNIAPLVLTSTLMIIPGCGIAGGLTEMLPGNWYKNLLKDSETFTITFGKATEGVDRATQCLAKLRAIASIKIHHQRTLSSKCSIGEKLLACDSWRSSDRELESAKKIASKFGINFTDKEIYPQD